MSTKPTKSVVQETFVLPSLGKLYSTPDKEFPSEVSLRSLTTFEEKIRLSGQGFYQTMSKLIDTVTESPEDFNSQDLTVFDFYFLMYKMRSVTYGHNYKVTVTCPHCNKTSVLTVDLDEIKVKTLPDDFVEPFKVGPLPRSGDVLECRFLRIKDYLKNEKRAKEILRNTPNYEGDPANLLAVASRIVTINGEEKTSIEKEMYVEKMNALDNAYLTQYCDFIEDKVGMDTECHDTCPGCGEDLIFDLPFNREFFRPTFDF